MLDHGRIVVANTFHSQEVDLSRVNMFPDVFINGKRASFGGAGSQEKNDDSTYRVFSAMNIEDIDIGQALKIKIACNHIFNYDTGRRLRGKWVFEFEATGERLMAETKTIGIDNELRLPNGQRITFVVDVR